MMNKFKRREIILFIEVLILLIIDDINTSPISGQFSNNNLITTSTKCENITFKDQCPELKYNQTSSTEHHGSISDISLLTTKEMKKNLSSIFENATTNCSKQVRFLICSSIYPMCTDEVSQPIYPCRNVCEMVNRNCAGDLSLEHWMRSLNCDQLPQNEKNELCLDMPDEVKAMENINNFSTILSTENYSNDNLTSNIDDEIELDEDQPMKIPINSQSQQTTFWWKLTQSQNMYNKVATLLTCPTNFTLNEMGTYCIYKCETDAYYSTHQKKVIETCILVFSVICFIFTLFSLITFWTESARFDFPERPILFLTLCYNLLSLSFIFKIFYQKSTTTMQILNTQISEEVVEFNSIKATELIENQCSIDSKCLIYFIIVSYLIISASFWWLIFGLCWWLSASQQWSPEALEKKSGLFHVIAWLLPISFPTAALLFGVIEKVESIGMCTAFGFTEYPTLILLIIGELFIILSAKSLKRLELSWKNDKLAQVTSKILMFGIIFVAPMIISILLMLFDYDKVLKPCLPGEICYQPEKRKINITVIRYACLLIGGIICGSWVWSKKTCLSCRKKITIQYYSNSSSPQTMIETLNSLPAKQTAYNKYVNSLHKSLLSNNYSVKKQHVSEIQKTPEKVDWISSPYRSN